MKELFHIGNIDELPSNAELSLFVTQHEMAFAITTQQGSHLQALRYARIDDWNEQELAAFIATYPILERAYERTHLAVATTQLTWRPGGAVDPVDAAVFLTTLGFACRATTCQQDVVPAYDGTLMYAIEPAVAEWFSRHFSGIRYRYLYTPMLTNEVAGDEAMIRIDLRSSDFALLITRGTSLLALQEYEYETPADVLYQLLRYTGTFGLSQQDTPVELSGLIDRDSAMYQELYQYFVRLTVKDSGWPDEPAHFFRNLKVLATCGS